MTALADVATDTSLSVINGNLLSAIALLTSIDNTADPLTDTQLRASPVPISASSLPLPTGAAAATDISAQTTALLTPLASIVASLFTGADTWASGNSGQLVQGVRKDADAALTIDGRFSPLQLDTLGRLKASVQPAIYTATTGNITANGQTVSMACRNMGHAVLYCTGTFSGISVNFEASVDSTTGSDGNWFAIDVKRTGSNTVEISSGTLSSAPGYGWRVNLVGLKYIRVRATLFTSGTQVWTMQPSAMAVDSSPANQVSGTQPISGTLTSAGTTTNTPATPLTHIASSAASTNATSVKASAGTLYGVVVSNAGASAAYLKLYNIASAPTPGGTIVNMLIPIPATSVVSVNFGAMGMRYTLGIGYATTTLPADSDATAVAANQMKINISYL